MEPSVRSDAATDPQQNIQISYENDTLNVNNLTLIYYVTTNHKLHPCRTGRP